MLGVTLPLPVGLGETEPEMVVDGVTDDEMLPVTLLEGDTDHDGDAVTDTEADADGDRVAVTVTDTLALAEGDGVTDGDGAMHRLVMMTLPSEPEPLRGPPPTYSVEPP